MDTSLLKCESFLYFKFHRKLQMHALFIKAEQNSSNNRAYFVKTFKVVVMLVEL